MTLLDHEPFARRRTPEVAARQFVRRPGAGFLILIFLAVSLLVLSRLEHVWITGVKEWIRTVATPVVEALAVPVHGLRRLFDAGDHAGGTAGTAPGDGAALAQELAQWEWRARQLEHENRALRRQLQAAADLPGSFVTGRLVADGRGPFLKSLLINVGRVHRVEPGLAVLDAHGVIGRIVEADEGASRILLLDDLNSRVPVIVGEERTRAIAAGENVDTLALLYTRQGEEFRAGDLVATSGAGGVFPAGLRVGKIEMVNGQPRIRPFGRPMTSEFASVLLYSPPRVLSDDLARAGEGGRASPLVGRNETALVRGRRGTPAGEAGK
ncbi:MAG: hypothetical protein GC150_08420 [Rhizobiales bacterium]|nr:hypothetical protein [Hyphomicrobiales bacterium]